MPGVGVRITHYGWLERCYFDGGASGKAYAVLENSGYAEAFLERCTTERNAAAFASNAAAIRFHFRDCHIEGGGWVSPSTDPAIVLNYPGGAWPALIDIEGQFDLSMYLNYTHRRPVAWFKANADATAKMIKGFQYAVVSGTPTVSFDDWGIKVAAGTADAVVDLWTQVYNHMEVLVGGYLKGVGEARFIDGGLSNYVALGIDASQNLYLKQVSGTAYSETQSIDAGASEYEVIGFIELDMPTKRIAYWKSNVVQSKTVSFTRGMTTWGCNRVRIYVPANNTLTFAPKFYTRYP
jgi:hypothetical protein